MSKDLVNEIASRQLKSNIPDFKSGDTVKVSVKITENNKSRIQVFQGVVMQRRGSGVSATFTVRKVSSGIGVERTFPLHSPVVSKIEVTKHGKVRRNKITYLRKRAGKSARIEENLNSQDKVEEKK